MTAAAEDYKSFIKEVYVAPIRSVLAIDDDFPTIDKFLGYDEEKFKAIKPNENWERLRKLASFCRSQDKEMLLDVHDGEHEDLENDLPLKTLRQCDWVVLDYQLNGPTGDGKKCCSIIRNLASSEHFNLVTIYTQKSLPEVFQEVLMEFSSAIAAEDLSPDNLDDYLEGWEDKDPEVHDNLIGSISGGVYFRLATSKLWKTGSSKSEILRDFYHIWESAGAEFQKHRNLLQLLGRTVRSYEKEKSIPQEAAVPIMECSLLDAEHKWIQAGNLFISFVEKEEDPANLLTRMLTCLSEWNPPPNRLALAKLRAELDAIGLMGDPPSSEYLHIQAYWLKNLLESEAWERGEQISSLVDRQTELLFDRLRDRVTTFVSKVIDNIEIAGNSKSVIERFYKEAANAAHGVVGHNTLVSNKRIAGSNLTSGHIISISKIDSTDQEFWICLSPACDLVPHRKNVRGLKSRLGKWMPFTAIKLVSLDAKKCLKLATQGHIIFIKTSEGYSHYSIYPDGDISRNLEWEEFFAENEGIISPPTNVALKLAQLHKIIESPGNELSFEYLNASIIAQLRTEYTASLAQRFSSHLSRVGLDFSRD